MCLNNLRTRFRGRGCRDKGLPHSPAFYPPGPAHGLWFCTKTLRLKVRGRKWVDRLARFAVPAFLQDAMNFAD
jgi:hypothetical protein